MAMTTIGDGMVALALAGGIVGYVFIKHASRQKRMQIIHEERMAALEKGIPLPEFPLDLMQERPQGPQPPVIPILGIVLSTLSFGAMITLYWILPADNHSRLWLCPFPLALLGIGLTIFHVLGKARR